MKVENFHGVQNQFIITDGTTTSFQSYQTSIIEIHYGSAFVRINKHACNYSRTTSKYLYKFIEEFLNVKADKKMIERWIKTKEAPEIKLYNNLWDVQIMS